MTMTVERCDRCMESLAPEAAAQGWPVPVGGDQQTDVEYVGPCCLDGYCPEGHVLPGWEDSDDCDECAQPAT